MKYYIEIDERDIDRFRIDDPCNGSHGNDVLVLEDKYHCTIGFELLKERPHGEWSALEYGYKCSVCSAAFYTHSNFCPRCGADMREGEKK